MKAITDALDVSRANQYEPKKGRKRYGTRTDDENYLPLVKEITDGRSTYGYRRVTAVMNRILMGKGEKRVNHKRVYRIMRIHHLLLQKYTGRPVRAMGEEETDDVQVIAQCCKVERREPILIPCVHVRAGGKELTDSVNVPLVGG